MDPQKTKGISPDRRGFCFGRRCLCLSLTLFSGFLVSYELFFSTPLRIDPLGHVITVNAAVQPNGTKICDDAQRKTGSCSISDTGPATKVAQENVGRKFVNPHDFGYIHNTPDACAGRNDIELVVGIPGRTTSFEARSAIRETWGHFGKDSSVRAVRLFFLGATENATVQAKIDAESQDYGDIVQEDFLDTYRNLSLKTAALMKWVSTFCPNSTFTLKADDDMYINIGNLMKKLRTHLSKYGGLFIVGHVHDKIKPIRDPNSKYLVRPEEFSKQYFPRYVSGTSYALTTKAAGKLYLASLNVPPFVFEDVYMTGLVANKANIQRVHEPDFTKFTWDGCELRKKIGSGHTNTPDIIRKIHKNFIDPNIKC